MVPTYIAAAFAQKERVIELTGKLRPLGYAANMKWVMHQAFRGDPDFDEKMASYALEDFDDIYNSYLLILLEPGYMTDTHGREVELGLGLALCSDVWIVGSRENVFHYLCPPRDRAVARVRRFENEEELIVYARTAHADIGWSQGR